MRTRTATLQEWFKTELKRRNISGRAAARESRVGSAVVQNLLAHGSIPQDPNLKKLATWAGVPFAYLRDMAHPSCDEAAGPETAIRYLSPSPEDDLYTRIDTVRAKIQLTTLQWLDPWLDERRIVGRERLSHYELAARLAGSGNDGNSTTRPEDGRGQHQSDFEEPGDLPPR